MSSRVRIAVAVVALAAAWALLAPPRTHAATDQTLTEGFPTKLADAFPIATGDGAIFVGAGFSLQRESAHRGEFPMAIQYGILPRTQLGVGTVLTTDPHETEDPASGDVNANVRVSLFHERFYVPSFAALVGVTLPTGVGSSAYTVQAKGYASKSITAALAVHVTAELDVADRADAGNRQARYHLVMGPELVVPQYAPLILVADVFVDQAARVRDPDTVGVEAGLRHRLTENLYWHASAGTEAFGPGSRAPFFFTTGFSYGFTFPSR